jgi:hypothetical protein
MRVLLWERHQYRLAALLCGVLGPRVTLPMLEVPVPAANNVARLIELLRGTIDRDHSPLSPRIKAASSILLGEPPGGCGGTILSGTWGGIDGPEKSTPDATPFRNSATSRGWLSPLRECLLQRIPALNYYRAHIEAGLGSVFRCISRRDALG